MSPEEFVSELREHGLIRVNDPPDDVRAVWRRLIYAAKERRVVPAGLYLRHSGRDRGDLVIELCAGQHPDTTYRDTKPGLIATDPAPRDPHPVAVELLREWRTLGLSDSSVSRGRAIVHSLATEVERRGHTIAVHSSGPLALEVQVREWTFVVCLSEERERREVLPEGEELEAVTKYDWQRVPATVMDVPAGRLALELPSDYSFSGRRHRWADRARWTLEDKLSELLAEIEARATMLDERRTAEKEAQRSRAVAWETVMKDARTQFAFEHRREILLGQVSAWQESMSVASYCDALEEHALRESDPMRAAEIQHWVDWCRLYAESRDPLRGDLTVPQPPEPTLEQLRPFLGRWSPHGPEASY
jgi:hypothetical protein